MTDERVLWTAPDAEAPSWTIAVAGDAVLADWVLNDDGSVETQETGEALWQARAGRSAPLVAGADQVVLNLESPLGVKGLQPAPKAGLGSIMAGAPEACAYLAGLRVAVAGLANNHAYDFGADGVERTRREVEAVGIAAPGAGHTLADPPAVHLLHGPGREPPAAAWVAAGRSVQLATRRRPGCETASRERGIEAVTAARAQGAETLIALLHLGIERTNRPDPDDVRLMDDLARLGFDVVAACHSHRTSGYAVIERAGYRAGICLYGLGSLLAAFTNEPLEREGLVVHVGLDPNGRPARVAIRPVLLAADGVGEVPGAAEAQAILEGVEAVSREVADGTYATRYYADLAEGLAGRQWRDAVAAFRAGGVRGLAGKAGRLRRRHLHAAARALRSRLEKGL